MTPIAPNDPNDPNDPVVPEEVTTVLLSRVAQNVYWAGRYLERAEATARLVRTHTELYLDLPAAAGLAWTPLLTVTGSQDEYGRLHDDATEDDVVAFLLTDVGHPGSVVASLAQAREDLRVTRDLLPRRTWQTVNEAYLWAQETRRQGVDRRTRLGWTEEVIRRCHLVAGSVEATMTRDDAYSFLAIGRLLERADMTTRVLDVEADILLAGLHDGLRPYTDLTWLAVLRSLGAEQMFRRATHGAVSGPAAVSFLLHSPSFPRSVEHCMIGITRWLLELPRQEAPMAECAAVQRGLDEIVADGLDADAMHEVVDDLQAKMGAVHDALRSTYFEPAPSLTGAG